MIDQKEKWMLAELMQFGYDRNIIALVDMKGNPELEAQLEDMNKKVIKAVWDWFDTTDQVFEEDFKHNTVIRFCLTLGIGAAWFWENRKEDVAAKGLYQCMEEPRTVKEMDEYIEDMVGIWYSSESLQHNKLLRIVDSCFDIISKNYNLKDKFQEENAGHLAMLFGMFMGYTRIYRERTIEDYKGEMPWHWEVWEALYGKDQGENEDEYNHWAREAVRAGKQGLGEDVIQNDPDSEFAKKQQFFMQYTYNEEAGIKTLAYFEEGKIRFLSATPVFDTSRNYHLIIDNVKVWPNGAEATIEAHFCDDEDFHITFYDTNYLENKDRYFAGCGYMFDLYGIAYYADAVPEDQRSFKLEGDAAVSFNEKLGKETEYDENGVPIPIEFGAANLHLFTQTKDELPEDASFRAPVKALYNDIYYLGKEVCEVEIGMPYHGLEHDDKKHPLSVYISGNHVNKLSEALKVDLPIQGTIYLQGKMRSMVNWKECPSTMLHTMDAKQNDGSNSIFRHICEEEEIGNPMSEEEIAEFAKEVYLQQFSEKISLSKYETEDNNSPDFKASRNRDIWVKADCNYSADKDFVNENKENYMLRSYRNRKFPVIVYISLYDIDGNECQWLKGGTYTAKIHFGSVLPGQKMEILRPRCHDSLVEILYESYLHLDTRVLSMYLHKDLDFRSVALADLIVSRDEYLFRTDSVNSNNRNSKEGPVKPVLCYDDEEGAYIELNYPEGYVDIVKISTEAGFITAITITNKE